MWPPNLSLCLAFGQPSPSSEGGFFPWPPLTRGLSSAARLGERSPRFPPRRARPPGRAAGRWGRFPLSGGNVERSETKGVGTIGPYGRCKHVGRGLAPAEGARCAPLRMMRPCRMRRLSLSRPTQTVRSLQIFNFQFSIIHYQFLILPRPFRRRPPPPVARSSQKFFRTFSQGKPLKFRELRGKFSLTAGAEHGIIPTCGGRGIAPFYPMKPERSGPGPPGGRGTARRRAPK